MCEVINRAAAMPADATVEGLNELLPVRGWRDALSEIELNYPAGARPQARRDTLHGAFRAVLGERGGYKYVADVPVLRPLKDRIIYSLVYGTRSSTGIEVFRDCQIRTLTEQNLMRGTAKAAAKQAATGQSEMFATGTGLAPDLTAEFLADERIRAEAALLELARGKGILWAEAWPTVLARHAIRRAELNAVAAQLRQEGKLLFDGWADRKRVPEDSYRMRLPNS